MTCLSRKSRKPPGSASHADAGNTTYLASHLIVPHYTRHIQSYMRKIPSQRTPWMQGRRSWQQSQKTEGSPGKTSLRVLIWLTSHNSKRAWSTIKKINNDPKKATLHSNVTADQVAHQLLLNGKPPHKTRHRRVKRQCGDTESTWQFTDEELDAEIDCLKNGKAAGLDDIRTEQIKHFGPTARKWLLSLFNSCVTLSQLPKIWRKARVIAILKPGKDPHEVKSYRPISLLCHLFKLFERLILNRLGPITEEQANPRASWLQTWKILYWPST